MTDKTMVQRVTLHLAPTAVWEDQATGGYYRPEAFEADGFIHCTNGDENLLKVANAFYQNDPRAQTVLVIAVDRVLADVRYEDGGRVFPHIYGPLNVDAVVALRPVERGQDGEYVAIGAPRSIGNG